MKITELSIKRPTLVVVGLVILTVMGMISYFSLNYELLPKFSIPTVTISTIYPGASPNEVENSVTKKIEDAVASMANLKDIRATSFEGVSVVVVEMNSDANPDLGLQEAQRKINAILSTLPDDVKAPSLDKVSLEDLPIITLSAAAKMDAKSFYDLVDQRLQPALSRINGVAKINLIGGEEREIRVNINSDRLQAYGISVLQIQQTINSSNLDFPTGKVMSAENQITVRLNGKYQNLEELRNLVIKTGPDGSLVRVRDVAEVQDGIKEVEKIARVNRQNAIALTVQKQSDANAVKVSEGVHKEIEALNKQYANIGLKISIAQDSTTYTLDSADAVIEDLFIAIFLVAFVMLFFLHSLRNALIVMVSIPASLIATFIGIKLMGFSLNLMSLLGLSLVVGILVDDAIVVIENITRHMEMGKNKVRAAYDGVAEIGFTVTSITLVIVVVFLPISLTTGLVSDILRQFCVVVIIATLFSLLASFTVVPWLSSRFGKLEHITNKTFFGRILLGFETQLDKFTHWITGILQWSLHHKRWALGAVIVMLIASFMLPAKGFIGAEFIPAGDKGEFLLQLELPKDASVQQTNAVTQQIENYMARKPEVTSQITTVGQTSGGFGSSQATGYKSEIDVLLVPYEKRTMATDVYAASIKRELSSKFPGVKIKTTPVGLMGASEAPLQLIVTGPDLKTVMGFAEKAAEELKKVQGSNEVKLSVEGGNPEIIVKTDRDKMAALGLNMQTVGATMQIAFAGNDDAKYRQGEYEYDINLLYDQANRRNLSDVQNINFVNDKGELVKLSQFADVREGAGPSQLERRDKATSVTVQGQVIGRPSGSVNADFMALVDKLQKPAGVFLIQGGDAERQGESNSTLGIALLISILLVYLIMVALYNNYVFPLVVLFSIPLSIIGALLALALTNNSLNIFTILGVIMLIGLVAKNAILLVDFANVKKAEGLSVDDALVEANHARLRPILMTTLAMVIGMMPLAFSKGSGAEWKNGLAWVLIGGLVSSMFLTLVIVPVVYKIFDGWTTRFSKPNPPNYDELMVADYEETDLRHEDQSFHHEEKVAEESFH
jgi:HAE1 family hydrophobic/amphiphilic exporter-1